MYEEFIRNTTESDTEEKQTELENFKKDSEDDFEYEKLKKIDSSQVSRYRKVGNTKIP